MLRPFDPYGSLYAKIENVEGLDSQGDAAAQRLARLLKSRQAKLVLLRTGLLTSVSLWIVAFGVSYIVPQRLNWSFDPGGVLIMTLLFAVLSVFTHCHVVLRWAFRSWKEDA